MSGRATLSWDGEVAVLRMRHDDNRLHPELLDAFDAALDEVDARKGPAALVITGEGKFFSNGLDLDYMGSAPEGGAVEVLGRVHGLLARVLSFPAGTVAALNGHTFAAGAMLAMACDARVMREDRGFFCLPEVDIHIPFTEGMNELLAARLDHPVRHEAMVTGRRYGGRDALAARIVESAVAEQHVLPEAIERARALAPKHGPTMGAIKSRLYERAIAALRTPAAL